MKFRKLTAVLLTAALAVTTLAACGSDAGTTDNGGATGGAQTSGTESGATVEEQIAAAGIQTPNTERENTQTTDETIVIELGSYPDNFWHPGAGAMGANEEQIINAALLDRLVDLDEATGEVVPMLAESWEINGADFTFQIRQGVKMTDGSELTADDVVYSANVWKEQCASNDTGKYIVAVEKVDDTHVKITFNIAAPDILKMLTWANFGIVSEDEINALGGLEEASKNPVMGCGKYRFKECKTSEYVIIERNDDYWDSNYKGYFKEIKFTFLSDSNSKISAVLSGDAQVAYDLPVSQAATYAQNEEVRTYVYTVGELEHLFFNMGEGHPTSDIKVRQAIDKALDYDAIAAVATAGFGEKALSYVEKAAPYYVEGWTADEKAVDIEGAKALLAEAGYDDSNPLHLVTVTLPDLEDVYTVMQANLKQAGVDLEIQTVDMGGFVPAALFDKSYDILAVGDDFTIRAPYLAQFVCEGVVFGGPNMVLPEHEAILTKLMLASDDEASGILAEYQEKVKEDCMCVNLSASYHSTIVGKDIKGLCTRERSYIDVTTLYK